MTSLKNAVGMGTTLEIGGRVLNLSPVLPKELEEAADFLRSKSPDPLEDIKKHLDGFPPEVQKELAVEAFRAHRKWGQISSEEGRAWMGSAEGVAFFVWLAARNQHPELTREEVLALFADAVMEDLRKAQEKVDQASGFSEGNLPRSRRSPASSAGKKKRSRAIAERDRRKARRATTRTRTGGLSSGT